MSLDLLPENPSLRLSQLISLLLRIDLAHPLLRITEGRVILVNNHRGDKTDNILVNAMLVQNILEHTLYHITYTALRVSNTDVKRHLGNSVQLLTGIIAHQNIPNLRAVAVGDYDVISLPQEKHKVLKSISCILLLFLYSPQLVTPEERIASQGNNSKLFAHSFRFCQVTKLKF